jgi:hypothetical protein
MVFTFNLRKHMKKGHDICNLTVNGSGKSKYVICCIYSYKERARAGDVTQVVELSPSRHEALGEREGKRREGRGEERRSWGGERRRGVIYIFALI